MRAITFLFTFALVFCGASIAGPTDHHPGAGLFVFDAPPATTSLVVASR
jgi:hypothetical protein